MFNTYIVQDNLTKNTYSNAFDFGEDIRLVFKNAKTYHVPGSLAYTNAELLSQTFEKKYTQIKTSFQQNTQPFQESTVEQRKKFTKLIKKVNSQQLGEILQIIGTQNPRALINIDSNNIDIDVYCIDKNTLSSLILKYN